MTNGQQANQKKTGLYGSIYDFVVDYEQIVGVKTIYDMHRYLNNKLINDYLMTARTAKLSSLERII